MSRNGSSRPKDKHFDVRLSHATHTSERSSKNFIVRRNDKSAHTVIRNQRALPLLSTERTVDSSVPQASSTVQIQADFYEYIVVPAAMLQDRPVIRVLPVGMNVKPAQITLCDKEITVDAPAITINLPKLSQNILWVRLNIGQLWQGKFSLSYDIDKKKALFQKIKTNLDDSRTSSANSFEVDFPETTAPQNSEAPAHSQASHDSYLKKIINSKIEEVRGAVRRVEGLRKGSCLDLPGTLPVLAASRQISQYGAFKKSTASVSTANQSIRMPIRKQPLIRRKPAQSTTVEHIEPAPFEAPQNNSISNQSYLQKMRKFENNLGSSSHQTEYVKEEIEVNVPLDRSEEFGGELPNIGPKECIDRESGLVESKVLESKMMESSSLAVSLYQ